MTMKDCKMTEGYLFGGSNSWLTLNLVTLSTKGLRGYM